MLSSSQSDIAKRSSFVPKPFFFLSGDHLARSNFSEDRKSRRLSGALSSSLSFRDTAETRCCWVIGNLAWMVR